MSPLIWAFVGVVVVVLVAAIAFGMNSAREQREQQEKNYARIRLEMLELIAKLDDKPIDLETHNSIIALLENQQATIVAACAECERHVARGGSPEGIEVDKTLVALFSDCPVYDKALAILAAN